MRKTSRNAGFFRIRPEQGPVLGEPVPGKGLALGRGLGPNTASCPANCLASRRNTAFFAPVRAENTGLRRRFFRQ
jgi:hypothetical protein